MDKNLKGPDHKASLNPEELIIFVRKIRTAEQSLGKYLKKPLKDELINKKYIRKKIVAKKQILPGDKFTNNNIITKRSLDVLPAINWKKIIEKKSKRKFIENQGIKI